MKARVVFNNDSTTSISSLGVALFDLSYEGVSIGYMQSESPLEVKRGDNIYTFVGELRPQQQQQEPQQQQQQQQPQQQQQQQQEQQELFTNESKEDEACPSELQGDHHKIFVQQRRNEENHTPCNKLRDP